MLRSYLFNAIYEVKLMLSWKSSRSVKADEKGKLKLKICNA